MKHHEWLARQRFGDAAVASTYALCRDEGEAHRQGELSLDSRTGRA